MPFSFIQIILDVVYNHTNEADDANPYTTSFRGIDNKVMSHVCYETFVHDFGPCFEVTFIILFAT